MKSTTWTPAMHAVLDGEASHEETVSLQARLASDPGARADFEELQALFSQLAAIPPRHPPEGLVAAVSAAVGEYSRTDQPFSERRVLGSTARFAGLDETPDPHAGESNPSKFSFFWEKSMNQQSSSLQGNRKIWVGGGIAAVAVAVAFAFGMGGKPKSDDVAGTIVAAERYRAPQATTQDVQLGDTSIAQLLQSDAFLKIIKDPEVQSLIVEPNFIPASRVLLDNPEAVRLVLAGRGDAQAGEAMRLLARHPAGARVLLDYPDATRAIQQNSEASLRFVPAQMRQDAVDRMAKRASGADRDSSNIAADLYSTNRAAPEFDASKASVNRAAPDFDASKASVNRAAPDFDASKASVNRAAPEFDASKASVNRAAPEFDASKASVNRAAPEFDASKASVNRAAPEFDASKASVNRAAPEFDASKASVNRAAPNYDASKASVNRAAPEFDASKASVNRAAPEFDASKASVNRAAPNYDASKASVNRAAPEFDASKASVNRAAPEFDASKASVNRAAPNYDASKASVNRAAPNYDASKASVNRAAPDFDASKASTNRQSQ